MSWQPRAGSASAISICSLRSFSPASRRKCCASAELANWSVPQTLTAVLLPATQTRGVATLVSAEVLQAADELPGSEPSESWAVALVPDMDGARRPLLLSALDGRAAVVGPARSVMRELASSYRRAVRGRRLATDADTVVDTDEHLVEIVLGTDPGRPTICAAVPRPLQGLRPATADRLTETLRSWLLHQGHRAAIAADPHRPRPDRALPDRPIARPVRRTPDDPQTILELTVASG